MFASTVDATLWHFPHRDTHTDGILHSEKVILIRILLSFLSNFL